MDYSQALEYLDSRLNFERQGMPTNSELRLDRIAALLHRLEDPHQAYPIVHVAGTKGKGSTAAMIAASLRSLGLKVGLHTSPHMDRIEERLAIDDVVPTAEQFTRLIVELVPHFEAIDAELSVGQPELTYFEITAALTFEHFRREGVDWAVVEVGMGGRLDATNVVTPVVSVITSISMDHTRQLGNTLASIAREKAGIIKPGRPVVCGVIDDEPRQEIEEVASACKSPLWQLGRDFDCSQDACLQTVVRTWQREWPPLRLALRGEHQSRNCAVALATLDVLNERGMLQSLDPELVRVSLRNLRIPGRFEIVLEIPLTVVDVAHNEASVSALLQTIQAEIGSTAKRPRVLVFGASRDKHWDKMLDILSPEFDHVILTAASSNQRAVSLAEFDLYSRKDPSKVVLAGSSADAWQRALELAGAQNTEVESPGFICVTGSFYLVAEMRRLAPMPAGIAKE